MVEHNWPAVAMHPVIVNTTVNVQAIAPKRWALAWSSQRCTATRAPMLRTTHTRIAMYDATTSEAAPPSLASETIINNRVQVIGTIATMCKGIITRNALDRYAAASSGSANLPVNGWIAGSAGGRTGPSSVTGSSNARASRAVKRPRAQHSRASSASRGVGSGGRALVIMHPECSMFGVTAAIGMSIFAFS